MNGQVERQDPPPFARGDRVNVDGIGESMEVTTIKRGARGWSIGVRMDDRREWVVPLKNVWQP